jgi:hypothetical protein
VTQQTTKPLNQDSPSRPDICTTNPLRWILPQVNWRLKSVSTNYREIIKWTTMIIMSNISQYVACHPNMLSLDIWEYHCCPSDVSTRTHGNIMQTTLGAFALSGKATISFMSVCLSVCRHVSAPLPLDGFPWNLIFGTLMKICPGNPNLAKIGQNIGHVTWRPK